MDLRTVRWRKSSRSNSSNICVEVALAGPTAGFRDSKNPGPVLALPAVSLADLVASVR